MKVFLILFALSTFVPLVRADKPEVERSAPVVETESCGWGLETIYGVSRAIEIDVPNLPGFTRREVRNSDVNRIITFMNRVRKAGDLDVEAMEKRNVDGDLKDGNLGKNFSQGTGDFFLLENQQGNIVATAGLTWASPEVIELRKFYVDPSLQGNGLGKKMLSSLVEAARSANAKKLTLKVNQKSVGAIQLYLKFGFKLVGETTDGRFTYELEL